MAMRASAFDAGDLPQLEPKDEELDPETDNAERPVYARMCRQLTCGSQMSYPLDVQLMEIETAPYRRDWSKARFLVLPSTPCSAGHLNIGAPCLIPISYHFVLISHFKWCGIVGPPMHVEALTHGFDLETVLGLANLAHSGV
ncbi:hypothetical protein VNO77_02950 [Canavalia gladiata]|uniref:Uncharacterized protein n=1 Tax=Canavalia gladiata TaxID=3824 RepID=A0AAN9R6D7_CANGL